MSHTAFNRRSLLAGATAVSVAGLLSACSNTSSPAGSASPSRVYKIGIAQIVSHPSLDSIREGFKAGMKDGGFIEGRNVEFDEQNPQGDQGSLTSIANNFKNDNKDLVAAITTPCAQSFAQVMPETMPIIFAGVTDPVLAKLVDSWEHPGGNITGTSDYPPIQEQMQLIKDIKPSAKTVGIVYSSSETNAEVQANLAKETAAKLDLEVRTATVTNSSEVQQAAKSLAGVDAYYVGNDNTVVSGVEGVVQAAEASGAIVIAADPDSVVRGATAAYAVDQFKMGFNAGKMAVDVLKNGMNPGDIPVQRQSDSQGNLALTVNPAAAERQGSPLPEAVRARADKTVG